MNQIQTQTLEKWLKARPDLTDDEFAKQVGVARSYITQLKLGTRQYPSLPVALRIEQATEGAVPVESWPLPPPKPQKVEASA